MKREILKNRIRGMFLGVAVGDALGTPVELWKAEDIEAKYGLLTGYVKSERHKFHGDMAAGFTTDDTQLTLAVSEGLVNAGGFSMDGIAASHLKAYNESTGGWGRSTRESLKNLKAGRHWSSCAAGTGVGNGIAMKIAPLAALAAIQGWDMDKTVNAIHNLTRFTHPTSIAMSSGLAHVGAIHYCLTTEPVLFDRAEFGKVVSGAARLGEQYFKETLKEDKLALRMDSLGDAWMLTNREIRERFGSGGCYVYDSLPFTYAHFLREPLSIQCLYDCVSNGGDTDSNGSILGSLFGALHGDIFPPHLVNGLVEKDKVKAAADAFVTRFLG